MYEDLSFHSEFKILIVCGYSKDMGFSSESKLLHVWKRNMDIIFIWSATKTTVLKSVGDIVQIAALFIGGIITLNFPNCAFSPPPLTGEI
jgi:hypothetical protein